jgi:hypothetical protein
MSNKKTKVTTNKKPKPKIKSQPKSKSQPKETVVPDINKYLQRLQDETKFVNVKHEFIDKIPIQTHIGYIYRNQNGEIMPVVSAFILSHYISQDGTGGMMIKCGNRVYANLYRSIEKIYIYKTDFDNVSKLMKHNAIFNPAKPTPEEMAIRIKKLEETLVALTTKLVRSTSEQQIVPKVNKKVNNSITHIDKNTNVGPIKPIKPLPKKRKSKKDKPVAF